MDGSGDPASRGFHAREIRKSFGSRVVLDGLTLEVPTGCALGLLGANGSGKTTLLKILLGLAPADSGDAYTGGEPSRQLSAGVRERIGYVPQSPAQFSWLNGKAMLEYVGAFYPKFDRGYADSLIERWKVSLRTPIAALSPGQQQRLSIVRALAPRPDLVILDEPIASLDPATRIAVIEELVAEQNRRALTVIFSSHITGDLQRFCSHFAVLANGKIAVLERTPVLQELARVIVQGEESLIATIKLSAFRYVRKSRDGERIVVVEPGQLEQLRLLLPAGCSASAEPADLETVLSEWMQ